MNYPTHAEFAANLRLPKKKQPVTCRSLTADEHVIMPLAFITNSFYLPVDVLTSPDYKVEAIKQCTGAEFHEFMESDESDNWTVTTEGATKHMLFAAKTVGVSCRRVLETGEKVMIVKIWYGEGK
jgi:hypothetical protein